MIKHHPRDVPRRKIARDIGKGHSRGSANRSCQGIGRDEYSVPDPDHYIIALGSCDVDVASAGKRGQDAPRISAVSALPEILATACVQDASRTGIRRERAEVAPRIAGRAPRSYLRRERGRVVGRAPYARARRRGP